MVTPEYHKPAIFLVRSLGHLSIRGSLRVFQSLSSRQMWSGR